MLHYLPAATTCLLACTSLLLGGCSSDDDAHERSKRVRDPAAAGTNAPTPPAAACTLPPAASAGRAAVDLQAARRALDAAVGTATNRGHRFETTLDITSDRRPIPTATLTGRRLPDGSSTGTLELLGDVDLQIVDDRIFARGALVGAGAWRDLGSASGVALDVGRELLAHPFLLSTIAARRTGNELVVVLDAPPGRLRTYATSERHGIVTELLARARELRICARVVDGVLVADAFRLVTSTPDRLPLIAANTRTTIAGSSSYRPLRARDRATIRAPRVSGPASSRAGAASSESAPRAAGS